MSSSDRYKRSTDRDRHHNGQNYTERSPYFQNYRGGNFRKGNYRGTQNYRGQTFRKGYRGNHRNSNFYRGRNRSRDRQPQVILGGMIEVVLGQDQV